MRGKLLGAVSMAGVVAWAAASGAQPLASHRNDLGGAGDVQAYLRQGLTTHLRAWHAELLGCLGGVERPVEVRVSAGARGRIRSVRVRVARGAGAGVPPEAAACVERVVRAWHPPRTNGYDASVLVRWPALR